MQLWIRTLCCFALAAPTASAQTVDRAKLRQSIELPKVNSQISVMFRSSERDGNGVKFDAKQKIAELEKQLTGKPDDGEIYLRIHGYYAECLRDEAKAKGAAQKAEAALRPIVQTTDIKNAWLIASYGNAFEILVANPWNDCDTFARHAVSLAPEDWRTLTFAAYVKLQRIPAILCGGDDSHLSKHNRTQEVLGLLVRQRLRAQHVDAAEKALNEIRQLHDKAKQFAPNDPKRQELRYRFRVTDVIMRNAICTFRGEKVTYPLGQIERVLLEELRETARLNPDHLLWQSQVAQQYIMLGWHVHTTDESKITLVSTDAKAKPARVFRPAKTEDSAAINEALGRMAKIADGEAGETALFGYSMLAAVCSSMQDHATTERFARKMLQLDPKNQLGYDALQQTLSLQERHADLLQVAQAMVVAIPTARNQYMLARALAGNKRDDLAAQVSVSALKEHKDNALLLLASAALVMRNADDAVSLGSAGALLAHAKCQCRPDDAVNLMLEHEYLTAIHEALTGEAAFSRIRLQRLVGDDPESARFAAALAAIRR